MDILQSFLNDNSILTKTQVLHMLVALARLGEMSLINDDEVMNESICNRKDREKLREIAVLFEGLYDSFDYVNSPEFDRSMNGKSQVFKKMKVKLVSDPVHRKEHKNRFCSAFVKIQTSQDVYDLVPTGKHGDLNKIRKILARLSNPD